MHGSRWTIWAVALAAVFVAAPRPVEACLAKGQPRVLIELDRGGTKDGRVTGTALFHEYDCAPMPAKTYCALGIRLSDDERGGRAAVRISKARFVTLGRRTTVEGFAPELDDDTAAGFSRVMPGEWSGFNGLYLAPPLGQGGLGIEVTFTVDARATDAEIEAAFSGGHVGLSEGSSDGSLAVGHHLEVVQVLGARVASG